MLKKHNRFEGTRGVKNQIFRTLNLQGPPWQSGFLKLTLMDRNLQVIFYLKVVLKSQD